MMKKSVSVLILSVTLGCLNMDALDFAGVSKSVISISADASTGLDEIYVLDSTVGATASFTAASASANTRWYRFSNLGGAYAEEITQVTRNGAVSTINLSSGDMGYIVESGDRRYCYWVVDYSAHYLDLTSVSISPEQDCDRLNLNFSGRADAIDYYTINGRKMELSRDIEVDYTTLVFSEDDFSYNQTQTRTTLSHISSTFSIPAPLCDTHVTLTGDRFLTHWGDAESITSDSFATSSVAAESRATQSTVTNDNEQSDGNDGLGGSAPCEITFEAAVTDAAIFREWQISKTADFDIVENSFNQLEFTYTFNESGTTYVRFVANNAAGTCEYIGATYDIFIGESRLEIPNAFSPGSTEGVNDIWKVSYKSLVKFECHIFNRWGTKMTSFTDPSQGWDGKYNGKTVPAGTYFYVISAEGSDGVKYKRSGDINIINFTTRSTGSGGSSAE